MAGKIPPAVKVWLVLTGVTVLSFAVRGAHGHSQLAGSAVLLIAFFKVRMIGLRYMELHDAELALRLAFEAWVIAVLMVLLVLFWLGG